MNRRQFLHTTSAAAFTLAALPGRAAEFGDMKKRVGLIGTGWYGKCDLLRLIQVAPVDVVSLCDADRRMVADAADLVATRQRSKKKPRTHHDYREMLRERDLDIVLIGTPDHWHALTVIEAIQSGVDVYLQKPISVDVVEGQAILAAARKYHRVVQIGTQRRSTPHLVEARDRIIKEGKLGRVAHVEICCYWHMRSRATAAEAPDTTPPDTLDYELWTGPAPMRAYNKLVHPRGWRAFMEYGNGIVGDMCIHMFDMVRWMLDLGWPRRVTSSGGIFMDKASRANITDTQIATFEFDGLNVVWNHRTWGTAPNPDPNYAWSATLYGDKGTLKASVFGYEFTPQGRGAPVSRSVKPDEEKGQEQFPEDRTEKDLEKHCAPAIRAHMQDFLTAIAQRSKPVADVEQGYISSASCILANLSLELGRTLEWDPGTGRVKNDPAANQRLRRPYRAPWMHPELDKI